MKLPVAVRIFSVFLAIAFLLPQAAEARDATVRKGLIVGKAALYGLAGGLVIGLASQVITTRTKNIFIGGSIGMYAGILTGLYLVMTAGSSAKEYEGPDTYEDFSGWDSRLYTPPRETKQAALERDKTQFNFFSQSF